jgi:lipid II:glycine glycyltransferase (peptidoglycan interpeptide bridge formation enzyme)
VTHPWNSLISSLPQSHLLQTYEWGQVKARYGWLPLHAVWGRDGSFRVQDGASAIQVPRDAAAAALVLRRAVLRSGFAARMSILYTPKGPLLDWGDAHLRRRVLDDLQSLARREGAIFLKIDPDVVLGRGLPAGEAERRETQGLDVMAELEGRGWRESSDQVQFKNTVLLDISAPEEELLERMKQKTRYNIRLAAKKGVTIRTGTPADFGLLYRMYAETAVRDGFVIRDENYYRTVWQAFTQIEEPRCEPLIAQVEGQTVAAIFLFIFSGRAYYLYGMSSGAHREKMPSHLLQWEAVRRAKAAGCRVYDLWGAPDTFDESDRMWGVYRFKEGFGGEIVRTPGAWDYAPNRLWYRIYAEVMPRLLDRMRARGREKTRQSLM